MKMLIVVLSLLNASGCASIQADGKYGGRPSLKFIISDNHGCQDKITISNKLKYFKCF